MIAEVIQDGFFAAIAGIGFGAISHPPRRALLWCGIIAAAGHITRFILTHNLGVNLIAASFVGALTVGLLSIIVAKRVKCPPETFSFPALLPMIPGIYAYRTIQAFVMALTAHGEADFSHYMYLFQSNGLTTLFIVLCMVIGQLVPILAFKRISFTATR